MREIALGIQALNVPAANTVAGETKAVVKPMFTIRPELDLLRDNHEATPVRRAWHLIREALLDSGDSSGECFARLQRT